MVCLSCSIAAARPILHTDSCAANHHAAVTARRWAEIDHGRAMPRNVSFLGVREAA